MHFLTKKELVGSAPIECLRACVTVRYENETLCVHNDVIGVTNDDAEFVELPERISVIDGRGRRIKAVGKFLVSTETFNPFHLVVDMF